LVRCPVCGDVGKIKRNIIVNKFSYPQEIVSVPNTSQFDTIADAWDYAAKVCLRMSQRVLRGRPPLDIKSDDTAAKAFYDRFRVVMPHSDEDIIRFESIHRGLIKERLDKYAPNPNAAVSRMSLSLLYGAIVCTVMYDSFKSHPPSNSVEVERHRETAHAIYTYFSGLLIDERAKTTWLGWLNIQNDVSRWLSPNAAAKKHANETMGRALTRRQIITKEPEVFAKAQDFEKYNLAFDVMFRKGGRRTKKTPTGQR
jgi:hypothetical protein